MAFGIMTVSVMAQNNDTQHNKFSTKTSNLITLRITTHRIMTLTIMTRMMKQ